MAFGQGQLLTCHVWLTIMNTKCAIKQEIAQGWKVSTVVKHYKHNWTINSVSLYCKNVNCRTGNGRVYLIFSVIQKNYNSLCVKVVLKQCAFLRTVHYV